MTIALASAAVLLVVRAADAQFASPTCTPPNCSPAVIQNIAIGGAAQSASLNITGDAKVGNRFELGGSGYTIPSGKDLYFGNVQGGAGSNNLLRLQVGGTNKLVIDLNGLETLASNLDVQGGTVQNTTGGLTVISKAGSPITINSGNNTVALGNGNSLAVGDTTVSSDAINTTTGGLTITAPTGQNVTINTSGAGSVNIPGNTTISGSLSLPSGTLSGNGSALTNLNASQLTTGTVPSGVVSGPYSNAVTFNNAGNAFTGGGAGLTGLNASNIASGTLADARLSANVPLLNANNAFTGNNTLSGMTTLGGAALSLGPAQNLLYGVVASTSTGNLLNLQTYNTGVYTNRFVVDPTGTLTVGSVPWARLTSFPAACGAGQYVSAVGGSLTCGVPTGVVSSVSGSGAGISVAPTTGAVVVSNTGVTSAVAGTDISVSGATGAVTIGDTATLQSVTSRGNTTSTYLGVNGAPAVSTYGINATGSGDGVYGYSANVGVFGNGGSAGVEGNSANYGVWGVASTAAGIGGIFSNAANGGMNAQLATQVAGTNYAGYFVGNVNITGNLIVGGSAPATASGTTNYLSKFTGASALGNSLVYDNGTNVGIGETSPKALLHVGGGASSFTSAATDIAIVENASNDAWLQIVSPNTGVEGIGFSTPTVRNKGWIFYQDAGVPTMYFGTNSANNMVLQTTSGNLSVRGNLNIGTLAWGPVGLAIDARTYTGAIGFPTATSDGAVYNGAAGGYSYYNTSTNKFRCDEGGTWKDCVLTNGVSGTGSIGTIPMWNSTSTLTNSLMSQSGTTISIGGLSSAGGLASGQGSSATGNSIAAGYYANASGAESAAFARGQATGGDSFAQGLTTTASGFASVAMGDGMTAGGGSNNPYTVAIGSFSTASGNSSMALGQYVTSSAANSYTLGAGVLASSTQMTNNVAGSIMMGVNSTIPTLTITEAGGAGTTGNVGIGTSTPGYPLTVNGNAWVGTTSTGVGRLEVDGNGNVPQLLVKDTIGGTNLKYRWITSLGGNMVFGKYDDALSAITEQVRIDPNGNVGIGTISPGYGFDDERDTGNTSAQFGPSFPVYLADSAPAIGFNLYYNGGWKFGKGSVAQYGGYITVNHTTGDMLFVNTNSGAADALATTSEQLRILQNGRLQLNGNSNTQIYDSGNRIIVRAEAADDVAEFASYGLYLPKYTNYSLYAGGGIYVGYSGTGYASYFHSPVTISANGTSNIDLNVAGRIVTGDGSGAGGVWVDSAQTKFMGNSGSGPGFYYNGWGAMLDSSSNFNIHMPAVAANYVCYQYNSVTGIYVLGWCSSKREYKENIHDLKLGLETVMKLRPVTFTSKQDGQDDLGLIAEDVAAVDPLLATYKNENGKKQLMGVKYPELSVVLINATKELDLRIDGFQAKYDVQEKNQDQKIKDLEDRVKALETELRALKKH